MRVTHFDSVSASTPQQRRRGRQRPVSRRDHRSDTTKLLQSCTMDGSNGRVRPLLVYPHTITWTDHYNNRSCQPPDQVVYPFGKPDLVTGTVYHQMGITTSSRNCSLWQRNLPSRYFHPSVADDR